MFLLFIFRSNIDNTEVNTLPYCGSNSLALFNKFFLFTIGYVHVHVSIRRKEILIFLENFVNVLNLACLLK